MIKYALSLTVSVLLMIGCRSTRENIEQTPTSSGTVAEVSRETGERIYDNNCSGCHGREGEGRIAVALAGNETLADTAHVVRFVLEGGNGMPGFGSRFSDEEIAKVASFIRSSWGNDFGQISPEDVKMRR
jgi:mono/diheme cytochrome c family protein